MSKKALLPSDLPKPANFSKGIEVANRRHRTCRRLLDRPVVFERVRHAAFAREGRYLGHVLSFGSRPSGMG